MSEEQQQQQSTKPVKGIEPRPEDVLCGKDKHCVHAPGSIRFRSIIESYRERYASSLTKFDKMTITKEIYETLRQTSRFLKFNPKEKVWEEISPMAARDKCGHALRFANRLKSKKKHSAAQERATATLAAAPGVVTPSMSSSPTSTSLAAVKPSSATTGASAAAAKLPPLVGQAAAAPVAQAVFGAPQGGQQALQIPASLLQQHQPSAQHSVTNTQHQLIWGELLKRYDTMWNSTQIPTLAGLQQHLVPSPVSAAAANLIRAAAAAHPIAPAPAQQLPPLMVAAVPQSAPAPGSAAPANVEGVAGSSSILSGFGLGPAAAPAAGSPTPATGVVNQTRKPTLDDLCSILLAAKQQNAGGN
ncbi:expressed unknown protein [Seminavis robusta]|uniref:DUF6824 domain-containing protein n=1 Tax=Seminavis robusta TaxID=568900 RepID=A0A9N8HX89_9STRA|nr:expressed unknown protein [Seminavis robusta]|eukprot:Sro2417_g326930.1 n/a (359) ;mRNA; f:1883-3605